jgi:hypothetical protein
MSSGAFQSAKYQANNGDIYECRVQPETLALTLNAVANDEPSGDINMSTTARTRGSRRRFGVTARTVTLRWTGSPPTGYKDDELIYVPVMQSSTFDAYDRGQTGTYLGAGVQFVSKTNEQLR